MILAKVQPIKNTRIPLVRLGGCCKTLNAKICFSRCLSSSRRGGGCGPDPRYLINNQLRLGVILDAADPIFDISRPWAVSRAAQSNTD